MSSQKSILYTLTLSVRGRRTKGGISREASIPRKLAEAHNIGPGDTLTVDVVDHLKGDPKPRPYRKLSK